MKTIIYLLFLSTSAMANNYIPANSDNLAVLGQGYNSIEENFVGPCINIKPELYQYISNQQATITNEYIKSYEDLSKSLGFQLNAKARVKVHSGSLSAEYLKQSTESELSSSFTLKFDLGLKTVQLKNNISLNDLISQNYLALLKKESKISNAFYKACGDEVVTSITRGARLYLTVKINFKNKEEKESMSVGLDYKNPIMSIQAKMNAMSQSKKENTSVSIMAYQLGGSPQDLSKIFIENNRIVNISECKMSNLDACTQIYEKILKYAATDFPNQIQTEYDPANSNSGAADLAYQTKPWSSYGLVGINLNQLSILQLKDLRNEIFKIYEENNKTKIFLDQLNNHKEYVPESALKEITKGIKLSEEFNQSITNAINVCFEDSIKIKKLINKCQKSFHSLDQIRNKFTIDLSWKYKLNPAVYCQSKSCTQCIEINNEPKCVKCNYNVGELTDGSHLTVEVIRENQHHVRWPKLICSNMPKDSLITAKIYGTLNQHGWDNVGDFWMNVTIRHPDVNFTQIHPNRHGAYTYYYSQTFQNNGVLEPVVEMFSDHLQYWPARQGTHMLFYNDFNMSLEAKKF